jgi:hypothetical protein
MRPFLISACFISLASAAVEDFLKVRCSLDGNDVFYTWSGSIFSYVPQQKPKRILDFVGYNVARCVQLNDSWVMLSRELSYYLDPLTKERLYSWKNPITGETVNVVHVANDPVNTEMSSVPIQSLSETDAVIVSDIPLFYPNPLHSNASYSKYGGYLPYYEAGEYFKFYFKKADLQESKNAVEGVSISWNRVGPWLPWMKMGSAEGGVLYSCIGARAADMSSLPEWLVDDVKTRLPLYLHAPTEYEEPNETSQTYFMENFDAYLAGAVFPLPAPADR